MRMDAGPARMQVDPRCGGRIASLQVDGREMLVTEDTDPRGWGAYPMVPWAGRIRSGQFVWCDQTIQMPINLAPHAIHGTVLELAWRVKDRQTLVCDLGPHWPWSGRTESRFELSPDALKWTIEVHADEESFPVVVGWHPWFRRELGPNVPVQLVLEAEQMYTKDEHGIPSGSMHAPNAGPWDDCFRGLRANPILRWSDGFAVEVQSSCDHWVIYNEPPHAVCVEPQSGPPDAFNLGGFAVASPGHPVQHNMVLRWS